ncbi:MAG: FxLYD domain-containing protein [Candidatus Binatia bacterium]
MWRFHIDHPVTVLLSATVALLASCAPPVAPLPPPPMVPTPAVSEEEIRPVVRPNLAITDVNELPSPDGKSVTVTGTLVNRGTGPSREVYVHVEAINRDGAVIVSADSEPTSEVIGPGSTARFSVLLENRSDVDRYHVEAVSR